MRIGLVAILALILGTPIANADCLADAKAALQSRLQALPLREIVEGDRDGEHTRTVLEIETLQRFHTVIAGAADSSVTGIELLILDGTGWSKERGKWQPFAAAPATAEATADDEQAMADQLTNGATATCLGPLTKDGRQVIGFELHLDGDPSSGDPYTTLQLYVDAQSHLPVSIDLAGQGDTGPATTHESFEYDKTIRFKPPK